MLWQNPLQTRNSVAVAKQTYHQCIVPIVSINVFYAANLLVPLPGELYGWVLSLKIYMYEANSVLGLSGK